jgi:hypothetical protein
MKIIERFPLLRMVPVMSVLAVVMVLAGGQTVAAAGYHEYENPPCFDVSGSTTAFLVGGVNNGGLMNFDDAGVDMQYQACVRMSAAGPTGVPQRLEGWVWNDNLGWVSLYCPASGTNLGIACGAQQYGVTFTPSGGTAPDFTTVTMSGAAWGDNIGYISFNSAFHQMQPTPNGVNRGLVSAASPAAQKYAWADSVGWLDFSGVKFRWESEVLIPQLDDVKIWDITSTCDLANGCIPTTAQTPVANANDRYRIEIPFKDGAVTLTDAQVEDCGMDRVSMYQTTIGGKPYCARIKLEWYDNVDYKQTQKVSQNGSTNPYINSTAPAGPGAVVKPLNYSLNGPDFVYNPVWFFWGANVQSYAPTSDRNIEQGLSAEKFYYVDSTLLPDSTYDITKTNQDVLRLAKVNLMLFKYSTAAGVPGQCIMGDILPPTGAGPYTCSLHTYITDLNLSFKPLLEITSMIQRYAGKELNYFNIDNVEENISVETDILANGPLPATGSIEYRTGLANEYNYAMQFFSTGLSTQVLPGWSGGLSGYDFLLKVATLTPGQPLAGNAQPFLFSVVSYVLNGKTVSYFSNKMPRLSAGFLKNPVAKVQGNVYLTDYAAKTANFSLNSMGNIASNLRREEIERNLRGFLRGSTNLLINSDQTVSTSTVNNINNLTWLVNDTNNIVLYLVGADLTINCPGGCAFDKNVTFIVEHGNIFVRSDIVPAAGKQVGLIALRNLNGNDMTQGFLFLDKNVKWFSRVHVFLDRVMQSYDASAPLLFDPNGFFRIAENDAGRQARFKDQFVFEGTISSMNGIGNASGNPATDELGNDLGSVAGSSCGDYSLPWWGISGICRARVVDLNYLRYYGPGLEVCLGSEGVGAVPNVPRDQQLRGDAAQGGGCNPAVAAYAIDATALFDEQPGYGDLISGGSAGGLRSGYFSGKPASLENEYPVNFFYVPISDDLSAFAREQVFNQIIQ